MRYYKTIVLNLFRKESAEMKFYEVCNVPCPLGVFGDLDNFAVFSSPNNQFITVLATQMELTLYLVIVMMVRLQVVKPLSVFYNTKKSLHEIYVNNSKGVVHRCSLSNRKKEIIAQFQIIV